MEIKNYVEAVDSLAKILKQNDLEQISLEGENLKISISAKSYHKYCNKSNNSSKDIHNPPSQLSSSVKENPDNPLVGNLIKSPIIGTFYSAPSPDSEPFVSVGSKVEKGQVICIIESMKLMNEVLSDYHGVVKEIYLKNGETVEFDQKLMLIE